MMRFRVYLLAGLLLGVCGQAFGQCLIAFDEYDKFDSTRVVGAPAVPIGLLIPSKVETIDGPKFIEEAKVMFSYATSPDSLVSFFLVLATQEYDYLKIDAGTNIQVALADSSVFALHHLSDRGEFDKSTNMRRYEHMCIIPINDFYTLARSAITDIRIVYQDRKKIIILNEEQGEALRKSIECVGLVVGVYPLKP